MSAVGRRTITALTLVACFLFLALGSWQIQRRSWKLQLIARVDQRVHAPPVGAPGPTEWARLTAAAAEYRHVAVAGHWLNEASTSVQALTVLGGGYWMLTPLRIADGSIVLVNRGFVAAAPARTVRAGADSREVVALTGLMRMSEPVGGFLRRNDPAADRWYSRDVSAIAKARGLTRVAPYFIDADRVPSDDARAPIGGLTVIAFSNDHLIYAVTWYTLALLSLCGAAYGRFRP